VQQLLVPDGGCAPQTSVLDDVVLLHIAPAAMGPVLYRSLSRRRMHATSTLAVRGKQRERSGTGLAEHDNRGGYDEREGTRRRSVHRQQTPMYRRVAQVILRKLPSGHGPAVTVLATIALAGGTVALLPQNLQTQAPVSSMYQRACADQNYAWSTYTAQTDYVYCPQNAPQN
jgi:hypothetical protein